jgi:polysaccharide biosynthesis PFTS motif protein
MGIGGASQKILSVFDLPTFVPGYRRSYRIPVERISEEVHEAFYAGLITILGAFPQLNLVLKPKRTAADPRFYSGEAFHLLTDPDNQWSGAARVNLVDPDLDPYVPIAAADFCIGMPFTSPIVVALNAGRPAAWYDPAGFVRRVHPPELESVLVRGHDQLSQRVSEWMAAAAFRAPSSLVANMSDPGERLASIIARPDSSQPDSERKTLEKVT